MASGTSFSDTFQPSAMTLKVIVFILFVSLGSTSILAQHGTREMHYNFLCPIMVISLCKLCLSLGLYVGYDGESLSSVPAKLYEARGTVLRYSAVAGLYTAYDVLSFVSLARFDPQTYMVLLQLRTGITAFFWEVTFQRWLTWRQRCGIALMTLACVLKQTQGVQAFGVGSHLDYLLIAIQIGANCFAGVSNELLLTKKGDIPLNLQNAVQYTWNIVLCLLVGVLCPIKGISLNPFDMREWANMADVRMVPNIVVFSLLGLVTSLMLKWLGAIWRSIGTTVELFVVSSASALVFGYAATTKDCISVSLVMTGVCMFAGGFSAPAPAKSESQMLVQKSKETSAETA